MASELQVNTITEATAGSGITFAKDVIPATPLSHRNMVINGAMQVYQRGSLSITQTNNGGFALDRFKYSQGAAVGQWVGTMTQDALSDADIVTTGQRNALKVLTTTVENAVGADEDSRIVYVVEAQDCQRLLHGTSAARSSTLSFWAKSTVAANYAVNIWQEDGNDTITKTYTLAANTWTKVSITIPGNTLSGGKIANDNTGGLWIQWMLIAGSNFTSSDSTSWGTYSAAKLAYGHTASSISNPWGTNASDAWYITGVQFELGSVATPFEHRSFADELVRCQRYFQAHQMDGRTVFPYDTTRFFCPVSPFVEMRARSGLTVSKTNTVSRMTTPNVQDYWVHGGNDYANGDWFGSISIASSSSSTGSFPLDIYVTASGNDTNLTDQEPVIVSKVNNTARDGGSTNGGFLHYDCEL